jgi:hypothetical protein
MGGSDVLSRDSEDHSSLRMQAPLQKLINACLQNQRRLDMPCAPCKDDYRLVTDFTHAVKKLKMTL